MVRFTRSTPTPQQEDHHHNGTCQSQPSRTRLRLTVISDGDDQRDGGNNFSRERTYLGPNKVVKESVVHTSTEILSDPILFTAHIQEIDHELDFVNNIK